MFAVSTCPDREVAIGACVSALHNDAGHSSRDNSAQSGYSSVRVARRQQEEASSSREERTGGETQAQWREGAQVRKRAKAGLGALSGRGTPLEVTKFLLARVCAPRYLNSMVVSMVRGGEEVVLWDGECRIGSVMAGTFFPRGFAALRGFEC